MGLGTGVDTNVLGWGEVHENLPIPISETIPVKQRMSKYGGAFVESVFPGMQVLAQEGAIYTLQNPTIGTQVTYGIVATYSATQAAFAIRNSWLTSDQQKKNVIPLWIRLMLTGGTPVVPASAISGIISARIDDGGISRVPSAGSRGPDTPLNVNSGSGLTSRAQIYQFAAAVMTVPASGTERFVGRTVLRPSIPVTQDEYLVMFGPPDAGGGIVGTTAARIVSHLPPMVIAPGGWGIFNIWFPSNASTAGTLEYEIGLAER